MVYAAVFSVGFLIGLAVFSVGFLIGLAVCLIALINDD